MVKEKLYDYGELDGVVRSNGKVTVTWYGTSASVDENHLRLLEKYSPGVNAIEEIRSQLSMKFDVWAKISQQIDDTFQLQPTSTDGV